MNCRASVFYIGGHIAEKGKGGKTTALRILTISYEKPTRRYIEYPYPLGFIW